MSTPEGNARALLQVIADNFDLDIHTPNGRASTHSLAMIQTYPMLRNDDSQEDDEFERIKWEQMSDPIPDDQFPISEYKGAVDPPLIQIAQSEHEESANKEQI